MGTQQGNIYRIYKKVKPKLLKTNSAIWFNKMHRIYPHEMYMKKINNSYIIYLLEYKFRQKYKVMDIGPHMTYMEIIGETDWVNRETKY